MSQSNTPLPTSYKIILLIYSIVALLLGGWFTKNFLSERLYRDGYVGLSISKSPKFASNITQRKKDILEVIDKYTKMVEHSPWEPHYHLQLGKAYDEYALLFEINNRKSIILKSLAIYKEMEQLNTHSPWYKSKLHNTYTKLALVDPDPSQKNIYKQNAFNYAKASYLADHLNPIFIQLYAQELHQQNQLDDALVLYKKALHIDDRILGIRLNMANIYIRQNTPELALKEYLSIYEKSPTFNNVANYIGELYIIKESSKKALPYLEKNYETSPFNLKTLELLGMAHLALKNWDIAHIFFQEYMDINPNNFNIQKKNITILNARGQKNQAKEQLRLFIQKHPSHKEAKALFKKL